MRKALYAILALVSLSTMANAAPGDTTWVQANNVQLDYYNNFDQGVRFPDGTKTYRKIYMVFTVGKYVCPGTPQYCGDWDYTVQTYFMGATRPDTFEVGRLITPYAHTGSYRFAANWTQRYIFDVTDYYPVLRDSGTMRVHYSGYSGGFTADVKFAFIEGTPERQVLKVDRLWHGNFNYGHGSTPINTALAQLSRTAPANTQITEVKMNITGHGGDDNACAEFCPNVYSLDLNGSNVVQQQFFRDDCSMNDLYPQTGTWIYARANWCPGALVRTLSHKLNIGGTTATPYTLGMSFPAYTSTTTRAGTFPASYSIDATVIYYGATNKTLDASLEDIIAPTKAEYHWRENPSATSPILTIRNTGSTAITSVKFLYGIVGHLPVSYTWTGTLNSLETREIKLPAFSQLRIAPGDYGFFAKIDQVNGQADGDVLNNDLNSTFTAAPQWPADLQIQLRTNNEPLSGAPGISQSAWRIEDGAGNTVVQKRDCPISTLCDTTFRLADGAYKLIVTDTAYEGYLNIPSSNAAAHFTGTGLSGFSTTAGNVRVFNAAAGGALSLPGQYSGNFGGGFTQQFYVGSPVGVKGISSEKLSMKALPNPASKNLSVIIDGITRDGGQLSITDMFGRKVSQQAYGHGFVNMDISALSSGVYILSYTNDRGAQLQQRIVITR